MKIDKFKKIKSRNFKNFRWPSELGSFDKKNLIYGWNGTGKSTLADLFFAIEKKDPKKNETFSIEYGGRVINSSDLLESSHLSHVRVFSKKYAEENIFNPEREIAPILYLGRKSIQEQKKIEGNKLQVIQLKKDISSKKGDMDKEENGLDRLCQNEAKNIKDILISSKVDNTYNFYNKSDFKTKAEAFNLLPDVEIKKKILSDKLYGEIKDQVDVTVKEKIKNIETVELVFQTLYEKTKKILSTSVVSKTLNELVSNGALSKWVQSGLELHKNDKGYKNICSFCKNSISKSRMSEIESHFNESHENLQSDMMALDEEIKNKIGILKSVKENKGFPHPNEFYGNMKEQYSSEKNALDENVALSIQWLGTLEEELNKKGESLFEIISLKITLPSRKNPSIRKIDKQKEDDKTDQFSLINLSVDEVNEIINKHNEKTDNFETEIKKAREKIEEHLVTSSLEEYREKKETHLRLSFEVRDLEKQECKLVKDTESLDQAIQDRLRPARELNQDIQGYLGRNDIKFIVKGNGYEITRGDIPAENLSEGEKTAIAFLHFLKSLSDRNFDLRNGIVVIDDPISSLDSNSIYHAFGFMKERTKEAGQLFILTHNHTLFREVKKWFNHKSNKKFAAFYMLKSEIDNSRKRTGVISDLDPLLKNFESEYHFLFSIIFKESQNSGTLESAYPLPNVARRLLEAFLAFKKPGSSNLHEKMEDIKFDVAKKSRIRSFINTYSHHDKIGEGEHDPSILQESSSVLKNLLEFLEFVDESHFKSMKSLVTLALTSSKSQL